jgi:hypothetical protein
MMYKKCDQVGEPELGLKESSDTPLSLCLQSIRSSLSGAFLSAGLVTVGIQKNNAELVGMGLVVAHIHIYRIALDMRNLTSKRLSE